MNMNEFAKKVTLIEGKKRSVSIAQVKEIIKITLTELANLSEDEIMKIIDRYS